MSYFFLPSRSPHRTFASKRCPVPLNVKPSFLFLFVLVLQAVISGDSGAGGSYTKRSSFSVPLAKLSVSFNELDERFEKVRITQLNSDEISEIGRYEDSHITVTRYGKQTKVFKESPSNAHLITDFEAEKLSEVAKTLVSTLKILERDVQRKRWDRLLYLDAYLPRFLRGYYYLYSGALNSMRALPRSCRIPEAAYEVSLQSEKSEQRVNAWRNNPEQALRLRIASKELIYQIKKWQKDELRRPMRSGMRKGENFENAFNLFVRVYMNRYPIPDLPPKDKHL